MSFHAQIIIFVLLSFNAFAADQCANVFNPSVVSGLDHLSPSIDERSFESNLEYIDSLIDKLTQSERRFEPQTYREVRLALGKLYQRVNESYKSKHLKLNANKSVYKKASIFARIASHINPLMALAKHRREGIDALETEVYYLAKMNSSIRENLKRTKGLAGLAQDEPLALNALAVYTYARRDNYRNSALAYTNLLMTDTKAIDGFYHKADEIMSQIKSSSQLSSQSVFSVLATVMNLPESQMPDAIQKINEFAKQSMSDESLNEYPVLAAIALFQSGGKSTVESAGKVASELSKVWKFYNVFTQARFIWESLSPVVMTVIAKGSHPEDVTKFVELFKSVRTKIGTEDFDLIAAVSKAIFLRNGGLKDVSEAIKFFKENYEAAQNIYASPDAIYDLIVAHYAADSKSLGIKSIERIQNICQLSGCYKAEGAALAMLTSIKETSGKMSASNGQEMRFSDLSPSSSSSTSMYTNLYNMSSPMNIYNMATGGGTDGNIMTPF